jgi:DNA mismatch endonuclease, patch repair protein
MMSRIRGRDTEPELTIRRILFAEGIRYRVNHRCEGIRVDIVVPRARLAIFIDGCFWHGCPLHAVRPKTNAVFWERKLGTNTARDRRQTDALTKAGWTVLRFWEHEVEQDPHSIVDSIRIKLQSSGQGSR